MKKTIILFALVILIAGILRLWQLGSVPYGIANDEASYIYAAYTIWKTGGFDIVGKFLPLSINFDSSLSPVPIYLASPFVGLLGVSAFSGRLIFALLAVGSVALVFLIAKSLFKNDWIAFLSGLTLSFSPWHILVGRGVWDGAMALFFYLLGTYIFLRNIQKGNINWSLPAFLLAFFSYHATKVFFIFYSPFLLLLFRKEIIKKKSEAGFFLLGCLAILVGFLFVVKTQGVTRQTELIFNNQETIKNIAKEINFQREKSSGPNLLKDIFSNKALSFATIISENYFYAFSVQHLFTTGDINKIVGFGTFFKGALYFIDLPFLILGLLYLFKKTNKKVFIFIVVSLLLAPLPSTIGAGRTYIIRSMMMLPFLSIIVGCGVYYAISLGGKFKIPLIILIGFLYGFFITRFLYQYYFQFNTYGGEYWNVTSRQLSEYIDKHFDQFQRINVASVQDKLFIQYAISSKVDPHLFQRLWKIKHNRAIEKVTFLDNCPDVPKGKSVLDIMSTSTLMAVNGSCPDSPGSILQIRDPLEPLVTIWRVYEKK